MDAYHIAKFVHIVTLLVAIAASTTIHIAAARRARARTVGDALDWVGVIVATGKVFPIALATLVLSGSYMIEAGALRVWSSGFVIGGLTGVVLLLINGAILGARAGRLKARLEEIVRGGGAGELAPRLVPDAIAITLPWVNLAIVAGVVFDMTTKPALPGALGIIAGAIAVSATVAWLRRPRVAAAKEPSAA